MLADGKMNPIIAGKYLVEKKAGDGKEKYRDDDLLEVFAP
jgi:hypothetical protein